MVVELIKLAGAVVGLITGGFVLWERLAKDRPTAYFDFQPPTGYQGAGNDIFLVLLNPAPRPLFVDIFERGSNVRFIEGREIADAVSSAMREQTHEPLRVVVSAKGERRIELSSPSLSAVGTGPVIIRLDWRPAHFHRWDPLGWVRLPLVMRTTVQDLRRMRGASDLD